MTQREVVVYTKESCPQCTATTRTLDRDGIAYRIDDATTPANLEMIRGLGLLQAPVVTVSPPIVDGTKAWSGFRPDLLSVLAETKGNEKR